MPNAEKLFLWRACHRLLPTKDNLAKRKITPDPLCPICLQDAETPFHVLWACPSAMDAWGVINNRILHKTVIEAGDFFSVAKAILTKATKEEAAIFARIARKLWMCRNDLIFNGVFMHPTELAKTAKQAHEEYLALNKNEDPSEPSSAEREGQRWKAPATDWFKTNWDAAIDHQKMRIGFGAVMRNCQGEVVAARCLSIEGHLDPAAAETLGAFHAVELSKEMGAQNLVLEGDAQLVVSAIRSGAKHAGRYGHLVEDIKMLLHSFSRWECGYVGRFCNGAAHSSAKLACNQIVDRTWRWETLGTIRDIVLMEQSVSI